MSNIFYNLRWYLTILAINSLISIYVLFRKKSFDSFRPDRTIPIYVTVTKPIFYLSLLSIMSFYEQIKNVRFIIIEDGTLNIFHKWLYSQLGVSLSLVSNSEYGKVGTKLSKYKYVENYYDYGWSGKKFFLPLLLNLVKKVIILDADILTFSYPRRLAEWIINDEPNYLYMQDYENFSAISSTEVAQILGRKPKLSKLNSGLLCINPIQFLKRNKLSTINQDIKKSIIYAKDRLKHDEHVVNAISYVYPIIEQTLYWLAFERNNAIQLNRDEYFIFPNHKFKGKTIKNPVMIHFSGEGKKISMYKYLLHSLMEKNKDLLLRRDKSNKSWFVYSSVYCPNCRH